MRAKRRAAFTLLEMLAVVLMFALLAAFVAPNVSSLSSRSLRNQAERIAAQLELARQRTIATGVPHRLWVDLDEQVYRLEWQEREPEPSPLATVINVTGVTAVKAPIELSAPVRQEAEFRPLPGQMGRDVTLEAELFFAAVETGAGPVDTGVTSIAFAPDGSAEYTRIFLDDDTGRELVLEILPLADAVRIRDEAL